MGKKLDALLGRSFRASKFKALVNLAISRLSVLKNQRQARCSLTRSDVVQLLNQGQHQRALLRVEQVIKEQNMLDVFVMIEGYCVLLTERVKIIEIENGCPDELKEAISSLIFAASRCGEFPELQEIRRVFTSRYGKEFTARAVELRNSCGVNPKMIQMLSTRQPSLEVKTKVLKEIADENGIDLQLEEDSSVAVEETLDKGMQNHSTSSTGDKFEDKLKSFDEKLEEVEGFHHSMNKRKQYKDVADAAQEAFMSAAYAAAAARAAVELSRSSPRAPDDPSVQRKEDLCSNETKSGPGTSEGNYLGETDNSAIGFDKVHPVEKFSRSTDSDDEKSKDETKSPRIRNIKRVDSRGDFSLISSGLEKDKQLLQELVYDSDNRAEGKKFSSVDNENPLWESGTELLYFSREQTASSFETDSLTDNKAYSSAGFTVKTAQRPNMNRPVSMRTRRKY